MLASSPKSLLETKSHSESGRPEIPLHNVRDNEAGPAQQPAASAEAQPLEGTTAIPSSESSSTNHANDGTWGERDVGGPVNRTTAMDDFETMRRELSRISTTRTRSRSPTSAVRSQSRKSAIRKISSRRSRQRRASDPYVSDADTEGDVEKQRQGENAEDGFELGPFLKEGHFEKRIGDQSAKKVGVVFKDLTVTGVGSTATFVKTLPQAVIGTFGPDLYHILTGWFPALRFGKAGKTRTLLHSFDGVLRDGEMMLVLGRPGAGCSTFLKTIANKRSGYAGVTGDVSYGGMSAEEQSKRFRGEVAYSPENDEHIPSLTVWQTLQFALLNKTTKGARGEVPVVIDALLKIFGISHTKSTPVGSAYVPGVSGGERKRVSITETLAAKSTVVSWDNSTRGLDASTALDYAKSLRIMTDISNRTTLVTLYQAGQDIYDLMDKVMLIDSGRMVYQGPAKNAKAYFENLGYHCPDRQTTSDFLTGLTDPNERQFRPGMAAQTPKGAEELEKAYRNSPEYRAVLQDMTNYEKEVKESDLADAREFANSVQEGKSKHVSKKSSYTISFYAQVMHCTRREFWLIMGDTTALKTKFFIILAVSLIVSSLFYGQDDTTQSAFSRGGALIFSVLFLGWLQIGELMKAVTGREVIARHREYALYRPSAVNLARVIADFPMIFLQVSLFSIIMYFVSGLYVGASQFFIYFLFVFMATLNLTALYRMFAALSPEINTAVRFSGFALNLLIIFAGYVIPLQILNSDKIWFGWLYYVNPISYVFESVMANEFNNRVMQCAPSQLVPQGPGVTSQYQGCTVTGAQVGATTVTGSDYLNTSFSYTRSHLWRNFGVVIAFTVLYILVTMIATETFSFLGGGGGALLFKKSAKSKKVVDAGGLADEEKGGVSEDNSISKELSPSEKSQKAAENHSTGGRVFTWTDVNMSVATPAGPKQLLHDVNGYVQPGKLIALMGASGAGKTTLLNTLAQRSMGIVSGEMLVDGRKLGPEFQRGTGFCEQMDIHDDTQTIREALEFSAILRQDRRLSRKEKLDYVEEVIDLLELREIQDAVIMSLGVEQRKRLTIGVELAAKPDLLLFLDEPTSGLDSQSAYNIVRFIKKIVQQKSCICTIHQPSALLIQQFDMILALNPEGKTFYFGDVGENGAAVLEYFAERGISCPPDKNPAEFILETAAKVGKRKDGTKIDWNGEWDKSTQRKVMLEQIERLKTERAKVPLPPPASLHEYASPTWLQIKTLTQRMFVQYWRDPSYLYAKIFGAVLIGIFNGFTFWQLGNSILDMTSRMFSAFLIILIPPTVVNGVVPKFYMNLALWLRRELPSRIYSWPAFVTANILAEIPIALVTGTLYFLTWYIASKLPTSASVARYKYFLSLLFFLFQASWGQWITAFAPSFTVIANILPFFFVVFGLFNGVIRPYPLLSPFWRYWMYYLNPSTHWISGILAATLHEIPVVCAPSELARFPSPPGQSCAAYAGEWARSAGAAIINPTTVNGICEVCPYTVGDQYLAGLNIKASHKWRELGIFAAFCVSNWALVYFFIWSVRVKHWGFGLGYVFGVGGKIWDGAVKVVQMPIRKFGKKGKVEG